jgi:hypothetical protein
MNESLKNSPECQTGTRAKYLKAMQPRPLRRVPGSEHFDFVFTCAIGEQSEAIHNFLEAQGFPVENFRGIPAFREKHANIARKALRAIFERRINGWWTLGNAAVREGACTQKEFDQAEAELKERLTKERKKYQKEAGRQKMTG